MDNKAIDLLERLVRDYRDLESRLAVYESVWSGLAVRLAKKAISPNGEPIPLEWSLFDLVKTRRLSLFHDGFLSLDGRELTPELWAEFIRDGGINAKAE
jgi:hypothetical protein